MGLDFSPRMLERARKKSETVTWVEGDLLALPFGDDSFDAATVGFGVRNVSDFLRARSSILGEKSTPVTTPPSRSAASARSPVPQHASRTRSPGWTTASTVSRRHTRSRPAVITRFIAS